MPGRLRIALAALAATAILIGCGGSRTPVPVSDRATPVRQPESEHRTVVPGDTLYSIAWESGRDYRELAAWNGISAPYIIKPGQQLRLYPPDPAPRVAPAEAVAPAKPVATKPLPSAAADRPTRAASRAQSTARTARTARTGPAPRAAKEAKRDSEGWIWPVKGKIVNRFGGSGLGKGVDIGGRRGQPVHAAATGRVVYQGSGLRGYGRLIIIKHSEEFLSAYAHNERVFVKEGDEVKQGQKIAEMGSSGTDEVKLHFEIRRHGTPIDPLKYLPKT